MPFEELPDDIAQFFANGGELPASLITEQTPVETAATGTTATPAATTPAEVTAPAEPVVTAPAENPYAARLIAERDAQVKSLTDQLADLKAKIEKANEPAAPDPNIDPLGSLTHQLGKLQKQLDTLVTAQTETKEMTLQEKQAQAFFNKVNGDIADFKKDHADYGDAYNHLVKMRTQDFIDMGMSKEEAQTAMNQEEMQITHRALASGKNPGAVAYAMAQRYGYKPAAPVQTPENKLDAIKKGLEASKTTERATPPETGNVTLENVAQLSEAELNKTVENDWEGLFGKRKGIFG